MEPNNNAEARLAQLGIELPEPPKAGGNYLPARRSGSLLFLAGVISVGPQGLITGTVGDGRSVEEAYSAARLCALTQLAIIRQTLGSLDEVHAILTVNGYVNAVPGFADSPSVINGASDLLVEIFGDRGRHARAAVGVCALPRNALVELQMVLETASGREAL